MAQITTGRQVDVDLGGESVRGIAAGVDPESGALLLTGDDGVERGIDSGEVIRCRLA